MMQCIHTQKMLCKRTIAALLCLIILNAVSYAKPLPQKNKPVYAAIAVDAEDGKVLYQQNANTITPPASLTKIMTLLMLFDSLEQGKIRLTDMIPVSKHAASQQPGKLGLSPGSRISIQNVILALVTKSANDAASVAAEFLGGNEHVFAKYMTQRARQFGMKQTTFKNASGLPAVGQLTTARDMAILGLITQKHYKKYFHLFGVREFCYNNVCHVNHNYRLLSQKRLKFDGIKTGYVNASGFNVIASHKDTNGKRIIVVVMGGPTSAWRDKRVVEIVQRTKAYTTQGSITQAATHTIPSHLITSPSLTAAQQDTGLSTDMNITSISSVPNSKKYSLLLGYYGSQLRAETVAKQALMEAKLDDKRMISTKRIRIGGRYLYQASIDMLSKQQVDHASAVLSYRNIDSSIIEQPS